MRVAHPDSNTVALQIAVRRFVPAGRRGPPIWLVGASHVGESNYFGELQKQLDRTGLVLFEGVGAKSKKMRFDPAEQTSVQHSLAASLGVLFQLEAIEYDRPNFRNSDLTIAQLQALMRNRPTEAGGGGSGAQELEDLLQVMDGSSFVGALLQAGLKIIASSPKLRGMTKLVLIEVLGGFKGDLSRMPGLPPGLEQLLTVIIQERDKVVLNDLAEALRASPPAASIAVFYGAGHMADLEKRVREELGYRPRDEKWLTALSVNMLQVGLSSEEAESLSGLIRWQLEASQP